MYTKPMMWSRSPSWIGSREKPAMATAPMTSSGGVSTSRASISIRGRMMSRTVRSPSRSARPANICSAGSSTPFPPAGADQVLDVFHAQRLFLSHAKAQAAEKKLREGFQQPDRRPQAGHGGGDRPQQPAGDRLAVAARDLLGDEDAEDEGCRRQAGDHYRQGDGRMVRRQEADRRGRQAVAQRPGQQHAANGRGNRREERTPHAGRRARAAPSSLCRSSGPWRAIATAVPAAAKSPLNRTKAAMISKLRVIDIRRTIKGDSPIFATILRTADIREWRRKSGQSRRRALPHHCGYSIPILYLS